MRLHVSVGPNPRIVRFFVQEKGLHVKEVRVDLVGGENRAPAFLALNPAGQLPVLQTDTGPVIAEVPVICDYLESVLGGPPLIGPTLERRAEVLMWVRRVEQAYCDPVTRAFRYGPAIGLFGRRMRCLPEAAAGMADLARDGAAWIDAQLADRLYVAGAEFSLADIVLWCFVDFAARRADLPIDPAHARLQRWFDAVAARPAADATAALAYGRSPVSECPS